MLAPAIRFIAAKAPKQQGGSIQLLCHVKPGVGAQREGIASVSAQSIEVCVAAQAKDGEANRAVRELIAEVRVPFNKQSRKCNSRQVLKVPKSDVEITKGMKSRSKTVTVYNVNLNNSPDDEVERVRAVLESSVDT
ncbi:hypothetical protein K432DRAFT_439461 [Lepidopterella palustris CBS 459.81]|uniref:YggU-like protein n=1 Tax=Lepidopterella palustris CBS 459.81 TaxID=1314670 RepID=A0A8E2EJU5_9PEZI|nr:hypothetical protein K432DRAFT_439461 [Lepidopterella palustris CBS 459.81]